MLNKTTGEKIIRVSNALCIILACFCIAFGLVVYSFGVEDNILFTKYLGIAIMPISCLLFFLLNVVLTGFAEIVDNTAKSTKTIKSNDESVNNKLNEIKNEIEKIKLSFEYKNKDND